MKPSMFRRMEKSATQQREEIKKNIERFESSGNLLMHAREKEKLTNLVSTMKELKK